MKEQRIETTTNSAKEQSQQRVQRRIRWLWIGFGIYTFTFINTIRMAYQVPYQIFVLGAVLNVFMVVAIVHLLRRAYKELHK